MVPGETPLDAHGRATVYMAVGGKAPKGLRMSLVPGDTGTVRVDKIHRVTDRTERTLQPNHHYAVTRTATDVTVTFLPRNQGRGVCLTGKHHVLGVVMERTDGPDVTVARMYVKTKSRTPVRKKTTLKRKRDDDDDPVTLAEFRAFQAEFRAFQNTFYDDTTKRATPMTNSTTNPSLVPVSSAAATHFEGDIVYMQDAEFMHKIEDLMLNVKDESNAWDRLNCPLPYAHA